MSNKRIQGHNNSYLISTGNIKYIQITEVHAVLSCKLSYEFNHIVFKSINHINFVCLGCRFNFVNRIEPYTTAM